MNKTKEEARDEAIEALINKELERDDSVEETVTRIFDAGYAAAEARVAECPCKIADEPCHAYCTCIHPISSYGCLACARYGSDGQRKEVANHLVKLAQVNRHTAYQPTQKDEPKENL